MKKQNKTLVLGISAFVFAIFLLSFASAEFWGCFDKGEKINYCALGSIPNSTYNKADETCSQEMGCQECMKSYYPTFDNGCYVHGSWPKCNSLPPICSDIGGDTNYDFTPPKFVLISPVKDKVYSTKKVLLSFSLDERADIFYKDLNKITETWTRVCDDCYPGNPAYAINRSFLEGENNLMFKAVDVMGNEATLPIKFKVDSIAPRIYKTYPLTGFANGNFEVQFKEANPKKLTMYYGNKSKVLNIATDCSVPDKMGKTICETNVDLSSFNGQEIQYYFEIEDITGKKYQSRAIKVKVDTKDPVLKNPTSFFKQGEGIYSRYVTFNMSIAEDNFYKVTYTELSNPNAVKILCTRLTNGNCIKKQSFLPGTHVLSLQITDKAGHSIAVPATFTI